MMAWSNLLQHLTLRGIPFTLEGTQRCSLLFEFNDGRKQKVIAEVMTSGNVDWCRITTRLGPVAQQSPERMLAETSKLGLGGLLMMEGDYYLGQSLALEQLDGAAFELYLRTVAGRGDFLERTLFQEDIH